MHAYRLAFPLAIAVAVLGCGDTVRPPANPPPPIVITGTPPPAAVEPPPAATKEPARPAEPQFVVGMPHKWEKQEPLIGTALLLTHDKADAVIIMEGHRPATGTAADECAALMNELREDRRNRFSNIRVDGDRSASFDVWGTSWRGTRYGTITVKRYGRDGDISVTYKGFWPKRSMRSSRADYDDFVRGVTLVKE